MTESQIEYIFEKGKYQLINEKVKELAHAIGMLCPVCEDRAKSLLKLSEVVMLTNKAITEYAGE
jgi:hypothetical protein